MLARILAIPEVEVSMILSVAFVIVLMPVIIPLVRVLNTSSPALARKLTVEDTARVIPTMMLPSPFSLKCDKISKFS